VTPRRIKTTTSDSFTLDGIFNRPPKSSKAVVFAHGITVDKDDEGIFVQAEPRLNALGFSTLRFDFRAHGQSTGDSVTDFTISGSLRDLKAAFGFISSQGLTNIGLAGASFGGGTSALFAGKYPNKINKLFLANPALDYRKCFLQPSTPWAREHFQHWSEKIDRRGYLAIGSRQYRVGRKLFDEMAQYSPCQDLEKYSRPLLIAHGDRDSKVSYRDVVNCFNHLTNPHKQLQIIKGSEYGFHSQPYQSQVVKLIVKFFSQS
jgi:pimeloyl-ACP methyl ester carboxylesterase